jgi:hypothetical protein
MEISNSASATPTPEWRKRLDFAVQSVAFQQQLEAMQESGSAELSTDAGPAGSSSPSNVAPWAVALAEQEAVKDAFGRTPEQARAQLSEFQQQEADIDALRRQMGLPPINRGYNADYNPQNLDLQTMQPNGWVPVDPAEMAREQSIKDASIYVNDPRQYMGRPIIEAFGFAPEIIEEARRRAGSAPDDS